METREINYYSESYGFKDVFVFDAIDGEKYHKGESITAVNIEGYDPYIIPIGNMKMMRDALDDIDETTAMLKKEADENGEEDYYAEWEIFVQEYEVLAVFGKEVVCKEGRDSYTLNCVQE